MYFLFYELNLILKQYYVYFSHFCFYGHIIQLHCGELHTETKKKQFNQF